MIRLLLIVLVLAGCTPRGTMTVDPSAAGLGVMRTVFVGTTRAVNPESGSFGAMRSEATAFARYDISIPAEHELGTITWPARGRKADPLTDFVTVAEKLYGGEPVFRADLSQAMARDPRGGREAVIFVHGFNTTFAEGLYRIAQLSNDLELPGITVHYSWPSAGKPLGYVQDRDSALFARDGLEGLIEQVSAAGADRIYLVSHSLGAMLTMETLRQMAIRKQRQGLGRISGVLLISPDIDVDVFRSQAHAIGVLPQPFLIFGSNRDRALGLSARITGQRERLGNMADITPVADLNVTYLDTAAYAEGDGHFTLATSPALIRLLAGISDVNAAFDADQAGRIDLLPGVVLTLQNATEVILSPVADIADGLSR
ncbi:alpha/beta fold hydrolase [Fertoebacter nigrum]|uniref:Alpha/beta fold hydrolase n=1 Tax=Fertoeibacter niger TaxID=2656921 RepID=A0A8X8KPX1_9RHOB|nr:alpha/beta fold hydrolase [Fertoeibacter niger]NUB45336.1 alpha/beta fold hydrolase [Fertoeibacter niger]